jgi:uncharacterized protein (DUF1330 family)
MAKGYLVTCYRRINDQGKWAAYAKLAGPAIQKAGGRFIVRGSPAQTYEQGLKERVVIVEFDSVQKAIAAHDSADYQEALRALGNGAERDMRVVEGVD